MGFQPYSSGFQRLTASGVVSDSGKPILVYGYSLESGASLANPFLVDGSTLAGTHFVKAGATVASTANVVSLPFPIMFPLGCYVSFDANTTAITIFYSLQSTTVS
jgi:hypothetical protein